MKTDITSDGVTVWVNGESGLLGRFGVNGIDIHRPAEVQATLGVCLHCTHTPSTEADWYVFVAKMEEHYGVVVGPQHKPQRFKTPSPEETAVVDRYLVAQQALDEANAAMRGYFEPLVEEAKKKGPAEVESVLSRIPESFTRFILWRKTR